MDDVPDPIGQPIWLFGPWVASQAPTPQSAPHVSPLSAAWHSAPTSPSDYATLTLQAVESSVRQSRFARA